VWTVTCLNCFNAWVYRIEKEKWFLWHSSRCTTIENEIAMSLCGKCKIKEK
jgi:hypothetical protein